MVATYNFGSVYIAFVLSRHRKICCTYFVSKQFISCCSSFDHAIVTYKILTTIHGWFITAVEVKVQTGLLRNNSPITYMIARNDHNTSTQSMSS